MDEGGALGVSLRSTRGSTSVWGLALTKSSWLAAGLCLGEDLGWLAGLEVLVGSGVLSLAGLLCAMLKLSVTELVLTIEEVASGPAGLFVGGRGEGSTGPRKVKQTKEKGER